ncbi:MAG TPA: metallophosphoesterase, partial [Actinomycetota bacterium]|nr:metallophosphoesterase [Actinomycetota bacterium]
AEEVGPDDTLLLLGDLVNVIDYTSMDGILVDIFGVDAVHEVVALRAAGRFDEARQVMAKRRSGREEEIASDLQRSIAEAYQEVFDALPGKTLLILGNVDSPAVVDRIRPPSVESVDGKVVQLQGRSVGFIGGGLPTPLKIQGEIPEEEFDAKLDGLGPVDVLCTHMPPDLPELTYDVLAERHERGSSGLLRYILKFQPEKVFFGHIHQPVLSSIHIGRTHAVNAGYFRRTKRALTLW